ncbi:hypothetical protein [Streptomyces lavendofoliae]|uniref:hypothetical protein n=1 Tax=Streptomyces lavendofoliae TaxID=67314 RepID=UPI003D8C046E
MGDSFQGFQNPFGAPTDPAYLRFSEGLTAHLAGSDTPERWRWHPLDGKWYSYPLSKYMLIDIGMPSTRPPTAFDLEYLGGLGWKSVPRVPSSFEVPQIFRSVASAYEGMRTRWPHAVWSARTGEWRTAKVGATSQVPPPPSTSAGLPAQAVERIERVRAFERTGDISRDEAARLILAIVEEYT